MNLGKLLSAGKSFINGQRLLCYRQNKRVYLPKFNADKNPFVAKPKESAAASVAAPKPFSLAAPAGAPAFAPEAGARPVRAAHWKDRFNLFRAGSGQALSATNGEQTELSLETVKVVCNDLADADFKVVSTRSKTLPLPELPQVPALARSRPSLEFLTGALARVD